MTMHPTPADGQDLPTRRPQWQALATHADASAARQLRELFAADPERGERLHAEGAGLYLDYSRQRLDDDTLRLLLELGDACGLRERTAAMFAGCASCPFAAALTTVGEQVLSIVRDVHAWHLQPRPVIGIDLRPRFEKNCR